MMGINNGLGPGELYEGGILGNVTLAGKISLVMDGAIELVCMERLRKSSLLLERKR
jgi:hypothetical protein